MTKRRTNSAQPELLLKPPTSGKTPISRNVFWIYLALLVVTLSIYGQVRDFDFINYDDPEYVRNAHTSQGLTLAGLKWALTSSDAANWLPLTRLSHMLDVQLFGYDAGVHHLTNVAFHELGAALLFAFFYHATRSRWPSAFVAFAFALHPLHVESVAWVAERKDVLSGVFWFLTLWSYVRYVDQPKRARYFVVLGAFGLGILAKPMILTLPFVLLLLDFWPLNRLPSAARQRIILEKLPFFAISAIVAFETYFVQEASRAVKTLSVFPLGLRIQNALVSYAIYIEKTLWPAKLAVFYPYPQAIAPWKVALAGALLLSTSVVVIRLRRTRPYLLVGWLWFLGTLLPVIGLVQVGAQARADRYMYVPMIGLLIMLAWSLADVVKRWPSTKIIVAAVAVAACLSCAVESAIQIGYWSSSEALFAHALAVTTGNYVAEHNFGLAIVDTPGRLPEAIAHYRAALAIRPDSVEARTDLGSGLARMGRFQEATDQYDTALQLAPDCAVCRSNLQLVHQQIAKSDVHEGVSLQKAGRTQEALQKFEAALKADPKYAEAYNDLGVALGSLGQTNQAIQQFSAALRIKPDYSDARYNLELALKQRKPE